MSYQPLHLYSEYSFLESGVKLDSIFKRAVEDGYKYIGITDHNIMSAYPLFDKLAKKYDIKPVFGMDFELDYIKLSAIILDETGYRNLSTLSTIISKRNLELNDLKKYKDGLIFLALSSSSIFSFIEQDTIDKIAQIAKIFDTDNFYIGLDFFDNSNSEHYNEIRNFVIKYNYNSIAFPLIKYIEKEDSIVIDILNAIKNKTKLDIDYFNDDSFFHFKEKYELSNLFLENEINEYNKLLSRINFSFKQSRGQMLTFKTDNETSEYILKNRIYEGLKIKNIDIDNNKIYKDRLNKEFLVLKQMNYFDYFLLVQDYVNYAKNNGIIVGPGRGSAAGSLIAYLLNIIDIDPIKYNLLFERFLNVERKEMPDIDIDFDSQSSQNRIFDYLRRSYGKERVSRIATYQRYGIKQSLIDIGSVFNIPNDDIKILTKLVIEKSTDNLTLEGAYAKFPNFKKEVDGDATFKFIFEKAKLIEGLYKSKGVHAAGVVLNNDSLIGKVPMFDDETFGYLTQYENVYLEEQDFLKMDVLSVTTLSTIGRCLDLIKQNHNIKIDVKKIDYDDPKIYELIKNNLTMGLFQIDTPAALSALKLFVPRNLSELVAFISLDRPGPRDNLPSFSKRLKGIEKVNYINPILKPILEETYGIIIYQEQLMKISTLYSGFTAGEANALRKACSKKKVKEMNDLKEKFINGAIKKGHNINEAKKLFAEIEKFKDYGFCQAHSICYAIITATMGYLKAYYPIEFYAAILDSENETSSTKFNNFIEEVKKIKAKISLPNINYSTLNFEIVNNELIMPLSTINNLERQLCINIINERNERGLFKDFLDFIVRMTHYGDGISEKQLSKLIDAGCFDSLYNNRKSLKLSILGALKYSSLIDTSETSLLNNFGATFEYVNVEEDQKARIENEFETLGISLNDTSLSDLSERYKDKNIVNISELELNKKSNIIVYFVSVKKINAKNGKPMCFVSCKNGNDIIEATLFTDTYEKYANLINDLKKKDILIIEGTLKLNNKNNENNFIIENLERIKDE